MAEENKFDLLSIFQGLPTEKKLELGKVKNLDEAFKVIQEANVPSPGAGDVFRGLRRGVRQLGDLGIGLAGLATSAVGATDTTKALQSFTQQRQLRTELEFPAAVTSTEEALSSPENFLRFSANILGEQIPNIGTIILGGGVGGVIGKALARSAIERGVAEEALGFALKNPQLVGAFSAASVLGTGETAGQQLTETGKVNVPVTLVAGVAKGALDTILPEAFGSAIGIFDDKLSRAFYNKVLQKLDVLPKKLRIPIEATGASILEASTEATQEAIDAAAEEFVQENKDFLSKDTIKRMRDAAFQASIVGALFGVFGAGVRKTKSPEDFLPAGATEEDLTGQPPLQLPPPEDTSTEETPQPPPPPPQEPEVPDVINLPGPSLETSIMTEDSPTVPVSAPNFSTNEPILVDSPTPQVVTSSPELAFTSVLKGVKKFFRISPEAPASLFSVGIRGLPKTVEDFEQLLENKDPSVQFEGKKAVRNRALEHVRKAIELRNRALLNFLKKPAKTSLERRLENARRELQKAIDLGFRFRPRDMGVRDLVPVDRKGLESFLTEIPESEVTKRSVLFGNPFVNKMPIKDILQDPKFAKSGTELFVDVSRLPPEKLIFGRDALSRYIIALLKTKKNKAPLNELPGLVITDPTKVNEIEEVLRPVREGDLTKFNLREMASKLSELGVRFDPRKFISSGVKFDFTTTRSIVTGLEVLAKDLMDLLPAIVTAPQFPSPTPKVSTGREPINFKRWLNAIADKEPILPLTGMYKPVKGGWKKFTTEELEKYYSKPQRANTIEILTYDKPKNIVAEKFFTIQAKLIKKLYMDMFKLLNVKDYRVTLILDMGNRSGFGGFAAMSPDGRRDLIYIKLTNVAKNVESMAYIAAHELGHYITIKEFRSLPASIANALVGAYHRDLARSFVSKEEALRRFASPARIELITEKIRGRDFSLQEAFKKIESRHGKYFLNFDEWLAENMVKWIATKREPLDEAEKFISKVANMLVKLFRAVWKKFKPEDFQPDQAFSDFIEHLRTRSPSDTAQVMGEQVNTTKVSPSLGAEYGFTGADGRLDDARVAVHAIELPKSLRKNVDDAHQVAGYFNWLAKYGYNVVQLANMPANKGIKWLQDYVTTVRRWAAEANSWKARANESLRLWGLLGKDQADAVGRLMFELDQMDHNPTLDELNQLFVKHKITREGREVYRRLKKDFSDFLDEMEKIAKEDLRRSGLDPNSIEFALEEAQIAAEFGKLRSKPYFPHARFGKFSVVVFDEKGKTIYMEQHDTKRQAERARKELEKEFPTRAIAIDRIPEEATVFRGLPLTVLLRLKDMPELSDTQRQWIDRLIIETSPGKSFRRRLQRRSNVPGYSLDASRAYAEYFWHGSNHLARIRWGRMLEDIVERQAGDDLRTLARKGKDITRQRQIQDFLRDHFKNIMNPKPDWAQLRSFAFTWWLGFSPLSAAINITQIPMVAWPYLSARFSDAKASSALIKAAKGIKKLYTDPKQLEKVSDSMLRMLDLGIKQGFLEESMATELAAVAEGSALARLRHGSVAIRTARWFADKAAWMFQQSERFNRRIVFRAAIELALSNPDAKYLQELKKQLGGEYRDLRKMGFSDREALAFLAGKDAVIATQFEYAQWARPRFMRGKKATILTFFMFTQNMVWFAAHSPGRARFFLMMFAFAGLMGLPGAEDLNAIAKLIGKRLFGKYFDPELEMRKLLVELFDSPEVADHLLHGLSRSGFGAGLLQAATGWPIPVVDLSGSIGLGRVVPGLEAAATSLAGNESFENVVGRSAGDVAGASFGVFINIFKALNDSYLPIDDMKRWERALPRQMKALTRAIRLASEGRERTRTGATLVPFNTDDPVEVAELVAIALGAQPTRVTRTWDRIAAQRELINYWRVRRGILLNHYWQALVTEDKEARKDVLEAIRRFNKSVPSGKLRISRKTLTQSVKERLRIKRLFEAGLPREKMFQPIVRDLQKNFPQGNVVDFEILPR